MRQLFLILTIIIILDSCSTTYLITVHSNGSATAEVDRDYNSPEISQFRGTTDLTKYYRSKLITNIDTSIYGRIKFDINNIDSLGNFLPFHPPGFIQFKKDSNNLVVTDGNTVPFKNNDCCCCSVGLLIKFDKEIQSINPPSKTFKKLNSQTVTFGKTRRKLLKGKQKIHLTIKT